MSEDSHSQSPLQTHGQQRSRWYFSTAPCFASVFLWVGFCQPLADGTADRGETGTLLGGLILGGVLSYLLLYHVPATAGYDTGKGLIGTASAPFGSKGVWLVPGLLGGVLITAWFGATLRTGAQLVSRELPIDGVPGIVLLVLSSLLIGVVASLTAAGSWTSVARVSMALIVVPIVTMAYLVFRVADGIKIHTVDEPDPNTALLLLVQMVVAFAASISTSAPDFGMMARNRRDIVFGGVAGLLVPIVYAGFLGILTTVGGHAMNPGAGAGYIGAIEGLGDGVGFLLAVTSLPAASAFCLMASTNLGAAFPSLSRGFRLIVVGACGVVLAATGVSDNLAALATFTGAFLAPVGGVITADFVRAGWRWPHLRPGINFAGIGAVALGIPVGLLPFAFPGAQPAAIYSYLTGFLGYLFLCQLGLKPHRQKVRKRR